MKTVIAGLEEGLNAIADALEGGGGGGGNVPTPTLDDEGKVLKAVPQTQTTVAPEWSSVREVSRGGQSGQVLTASGDGDYGWADASGGGLPSSTGADMGKVLTVDNHGNAEWATPEKELPTINNDDSNKVLKAYYDSEEGYGYASWGTVAGVPSSNASDAGKVLTCTGRNAYGWAPASGGGGGVSVYRSQGSLLKSNFNAVSSGDYSGMYRANVYFYDADGNKLRNINEVINVSIMVRTYTDEYGFKFKAIDGALAISEYSEDNGFLYISSSDYTALDADHDKVYAAIICVPDTM